MEGHLEKTFYALCFAVQVLSSKRMCETYLATFFPKLDETVADMLLSNLKGQ